MATEHTLDRSHIHHDWDRGREPVLTIRTGDVVHLTCRSPRRARSRSRLRSRRSSGTIETIYNLAGPIYVEGASPGGTLEIEILELTPASGAGPR
jgi:acetamidase/formamidase